ncbi:MAG: methyltransferase domain-containing protein [Betaproteobacteria bacterium]|nr:methyltransferase domain-containing protein [Betaproteobacteria bacterium]
MASPEKTRKYWDENIDKWADLYLDISHSHESLQAPGWLDFIYKKFIVPHEAKLMTERYRLTMSFIEQFIGEGSVAVDVGCGTGIFTVEMLRRGARVKAVDFAQKSLDLTRALVERIIPDKVGNIEYLLMDVSKQRLPASDAVLAMGVTPYFQEIAPFYDNVLPTTKIFYCLVLDPSHWANRIRRILPFLNVRGMYWFSKSEVDSILARHDWQLIQRTPFATGYLDLARNRKR